MNYMNLLKKCLEFMRLSGVKVSALCNRVGIGRTTFYRWLWGDTRISSRLAHRINRYLAQFGFDVVGDWG